MKKFDFKLQTLLAVRKMQEDKKKRELAEVNTRLLRAEQEMIKLEQEWLSLQSEEKKRREEGTTAETMGRTINYRLMLEAKAKQLDLNIQRIASEQKMRMQALIEATKGKKTLENVKKKHHEEWKLKSSREDQKNTDDICQIQYANILKQQQ